jgi:hypothetical protein
MGIESLQQFLQLSDFQQPAVKVSCSCCTGTSDFDVIFVAIDFEYKKDDITEFGLSFLDTRNLSPSIICPYNEDLIVTSHLSLRQPREEFLFGNTTYPDNKATLAAWIKAAFSISACTCIDFPEDANCAHHLRNIVLVGHGIQADLRLLNVLGVNLFELAPVVAILDTDYLSRLIFNRGFKLGALVTELFCANPKIDLLGCHNAGNDACFTLNAVLMLAIRSVSGREDSWYTEERSSRIQTVMDLAANSMKGVNRAQATAGWYANQQILSGRDPRIYGWDGGVAAVMRLIDQEAEEAAATPDWKEYEGLERVDSSGSEMSSSLFSDEEEEEDGVGSEISSLLGDAGEDEMARGDIWAELKGQEEEESGLDNGYEEEEEMVPIVREPARQRLSEKFKQIAGIDKFLSRFQKPEAGVRRVWR